LITSSNLAVRCRSRARARNPHTAGAAQKRRTSLGRADSGCVPFFCDFLEAATGYWGGSVAVVVGGAVTATVLADGREKVQGGWWEPVYTRLNPRSGSLLDNRDGLEDQWKSSIHHDQEQAIPVRELDATLSCS
jgi:hypothetical protein